MFFFKKSKEVENLKKQLQDARNENIKLLGKFDSLVKMHNKLVDDINAKGGRRFLRHGTLTKNNNELTQLEIKNLLFLCHPDKHHNSDRAAEATKKLLSLREK